MLNSIRGLHLTVTIRELASSKLIKVCSVNHLLSPPGGFISSPFEGGFIATGGLLNLEMTMVSVLLKELEYKVENLKYEKF